MYLSTVRDSWWREEAPTLLHNCVFSYLCTFLCLYIFLCVNVYLRFMYMYLSIARDCWCQKEAANFLHNCIFIYDYEHFCIFAMCQSVFVIMYVFVNSWCQKERATLFHNFSSFSTLNPAHFLLFCLISLCAVFPQSLEYLFSILLVFVLFGLPCLYII